MNLALHSRCPLCKHPDSNTHLLQHCTHTKMVELKTKLHTDIHTLLHNHNICTIVTDAFLSFFSISTDNTTPSYTSLQDMPDTWKTAWHKGQTNQERTWTEEIHSRAAEIIINLGHTRPLWLGTITCAWMWLLVNGGLHESQTNAFIKQYRTILADYTQTVWKTRQKLKEELQPNTPTPPTKPTHSSIAKYRKTHKLRTTHSISYLQSLTHREREELATRTTPSAQTQ